MVDFVKALLAKKEAVYGTDAAPAPIANGILTRNFSSKPVEVDRIERNLDIASFGATPSAPSNERQTMSFEVEIAGSGVAGTKPAWMELLEACGMTAPVIVAGASATQAFELPGANPSSLTLYHWIGNQRRKAVGARGTFSIDLTAGQNGFFGFSYTGLIPAAAPFDVNSPVGIDLTRFQKPLEVNTDNSDFTFGGYAALLRSLKLNANLQTNVRNLVGARYVNRGNHAVSGRAVIEAPSIDVHNYLATLRTGDVVPLSAIQGTVAGNIVEIAAPKAQITDISESGEDGKLMWEIALSATVGTGADDLTIAAK